MENKFAEIFCPASILQTIQMDFPHPNYEAFGLLLMMVQVSVTMLIPTV